MKIRLYNNTDKEIWDNYVLNHPDSTLYHLSGWGNVINKTYGHKTYYLMAIDDSNNPTNPINPSNLHPVKFFEEKSEAYLTRAINTIVGILPLVHLKSLFFGNSLISIPFFDLGGVLADNEEAEKALIEEAIKLGQKLKVDNIELRHQKPLDWINNSNNFNPVKSIEDSSKANLTRADNPTSDIRPLSFQTKSHKVRMLLELPESSDNLMQSFKSKLRSQIKRPIKEGLKAKTGGIELLNKFYEVFLVNMRDLGSPVHSKNLLFNVFNEFSDSAKIFIIKKDNKPLACSMVIGFKNILENPWASSLREYSRLSPNMLLYWSMLEYACDNNFSYFDFGRSSVDEGTHKFKAQWGSNPETLHWQFIFINSKESQKEFSDSSKMQKAVRYWQKLPVSLTKILGPMIRKHIGL